MTGAVGLESMMPKALLVVRYEKDKPVSTLGIVLEPRGNSRNRGQQYQEQPVFFPQASRSRDIEIDAKTKHAQRDERRGSYPQQKTAALAPNRSYHLAAGR